MPTFDPLADRLIPAHAGKTRLMSAGMIQVRAHPRSRGENSVSALVSIM